MAPRANWKGFLKIAEVTCPIALYTAASTSERIALHTLNRKTGHRVRWQFVDQETGRLVEPADQVKGYEVGKGDFVVLEPEEIAAAFPGQLRAHYGRFRPVRRVLESGRHAVEVFRATMWEAAVRSPIASASQAPRADAA